jgi:hypothetical protein
LAGRALALQIQNSCPFLISFKGLFPQPAMREQVRQAGVVERRLNASECIDGVIRWHHNPVAIGVALNRHTRMATIGVGGLMWLLRKRSNREAMKRAMDE